MGGSTMVRSRSFIATPPGATIKEQLNDRGMSQKEFSARMDMSEKHISRLINGDVHLASTVTEVYKGAFQYCKQLDVVEAPEKLCLYSESEAFVDEIRNGLGVRRDAPGQTRYPMIIRY